MSSEADVLAEIARLSSAIDQHKQYSTAPTRGRGRGRGGTRARGTFRGRGRGGSGGAPAHRNATWVAPHLPQPVNPSRSGTTTPAEVPQSTGEREPASHAVVAPPPPPPREVVIGGVVFVADSRGNKLVRKTADSSVSSSPSGPSTPSVTPIPSTSSSTAAPPLSSTPRRTSHLGETYIRTKSGNLVSLAFARDRKLKNDLLKAKKERLEKLGGVIGGVQGARNKSARRGGTRGRGRGGHVRSQRVAKPPKPKSDKLCIFFQKTGQCSRAHTCRYVHDSTKISICPQFLRSACSRTASTCPLSHHPNPHRSPHCSHFPNCTRTQCPYAHIVVGSEAKVCRDFVEYGWCEVGQACDKRHVRECWRFSETGKCDVPGCKEPHVLRRVHSQESEDEDERGSDDSEDQDEEELVGSDQEELERQVEDEIEREEKGVKRKRDQGAGISGEAGRRLTKKLKKSALGKGLQDQQDFVELSIPSSDLEDEESEIDEDGMSVDSDDLAEADDLEEERNIDALPSAPQHIATEPATSQQQSSRVPPSSNPPTGPNSTPNPTSSIKKIRKKHQDQPADHTELELDYGLSSDDEAQSETAAVPKGESEGEGEGDETIYLEASEGFDPTESDQKAFAEEEEHADASDDDDDDTDVANLLRK